MLLTKSNVVGLTDDTSQIETAASRAVMCPAYTQCLLRANEYIHNIMSYSRRVTQKETGNVEHRLGEKRQARSEFSANTFRCPDFIFP